MFKTHRTYDLTTGVKNNSIAVINSGDRIQVVYHQTIVVDAKRTKAGGYVITLNNGGWNTVSTRLVIKRACEQLCSAGVAFETRKGETTLIHNGVKLPFVSGMRIKARHNNYLQAA